jgi:circadian clock protein KaiC
MGRRGRELERRRREITAQIEILQAQLASEEAEVTLLTGEGVAREDQLGTDRVTMGASRQGATRRNTPAPKPANRFKMRLDGK